ncbi:MAG: 23S rRNA (pseudouridine(1915)-N(3))-methyltransferase RlmH [Candidatus Peribacteria bacterium]|nr:23S rRNA (pseudouridine(1915)-N(3))-methyltransferase RlmH [Candidatus Peribacteria bacterium]
MDRELIKNSFPEIKELSFGNITMPHGLAKLVLVEQLYRCFTLDI